MARYEIIIELQTPLLAGEPRQGNSYSSFSYLPGSVLRGAVAEQLMAAWTPEERQVSHPEACLNPQTCAFCQVLGLDDADAPRFSDCYPIWLESDELYLFPLTAKTCKRHGGFKEPDAIEARHGIQDTLIRLVAARDAQQAHPARSYIYTANCAECGEALTGPGVNHYGRSAQTFYLANPQNRRFSRTAINRQRHTAQHGQLFTLGVMGEQTRLSVPDYESVTTRLKGTIESGNAPEQLLEQTVKQIGWLGSGTSRGLGQVSHVTLRKIEAPIGQKPLSAYGELLANDRYAEILSDTAVPALVQRIAAFNQEVANERTFYKALGMDQVLSGSWYFTVDLQADAYVRQSGLPTLHLTPEMLQLPHAISDFVAAEAVERGGWSTAWGLPLPRQLGIARGSTFLFRVENNSSDIANQLLNRLDQLEQEGIGADRGRGAGRLLICAPFHTEVNPK
ncbi:MAG: hypothetical protein H6657_02495 [Ardenticatenaceae bacterium]|nr:hypothetical protein [Anaerolineales bacterium]MCB8976276.1 hypothetical protein [Ardenticatenaceae bacterium]